MQADLRVDDNEHREVTPPRRKPPFCGYEALNVVHSNLKLAYDNSYTRPIFRCIGVSRGTMWAWFANGQLSVKGAVRLRDHIKRTMEYLAIAEATLTRSLNEYDKKPSRRGGFLAIKDHGDGLPPHSQSSQVLMKLGVYDGKPVGRPKSKPLIAA
jgi:hypothetical protein